MFANRYYSKALILSVALLTVSCSKKAPTSTAATSGNIATQANANGPAPKVELTTSHGVIVIQLDPKRAPKSVENFLRYVKDGHYAGTIFHRVIPTFMIQGGGFTEALQKKPTRPPIQNEADNGLKNVRGTIAMARTSAPHSASAQFFINVNDNAALDHRGKTMRGWGYAVFGKVVQGMDVVDKIKAIPTTRKGPHGNVPTTPVVIKEAKILP